MNVSINFFNTTDIHNTARIPCSSRDICQMTFSVIVTLSPQKGEQNLIPWEKKSYIPPYTSLIFQHFFSFLHNIFINFTLSTALLNFYVCVKLFMPAFTTSSDQEYHFIDKKHFKIKKPIFGDISHILSSVRQLHLSSLLLSIFFVHLLHAVKG